MFQIRITALRSMFYIPRKWYVQRVLLKIIWFLVSRKIRIIGLQGQYGQKFNAFGNLVQTTHTKMNKKIKRIVRLNYSSRRLGEISGLSSQCKACMKLFLSHLHNVSSILFVFWTWTRVIIHTINVRSMHEHGRIKTFLAHDIPPAKKVSLHWRLLLDM